MKSDNERITRTAINVCQLDILNFFERKMAKEEDERYLIMLINLFS